ncbi:MAG: ATP-dependent DNA helicase RecG [Erysipelotrichaceae bacterium]
MKTFEELKMTQNQIKKLKLLEIDDPQALLRYYPSRYIEYNEGVFSSWKEKEMVHFNAMILSRPYTHRYQRQRSITKFKVACDDEVIEVSVFNRPWFKGLNESDEVYILGQYIGNRKVNLTSFYQGERKPLGITPIYPLKDGVKNTDVIALIKKVYQGVEHEINEIIPSEYISKYQLLKLREAIYVIHHPTNMNEVNAALRTLKYEEFLKFSIAMQLMKSNSLNNELKEKKYFDTKLISQLIERLPFQLTDDQQSVIDEILKDIQSSRTMYRLVQGDVGSGKSIVAFVGLYANYLANYQGVMMVPTEILAKQQYEAVTLLFKDTPIKVALLYSGLSAKEKRVLLDKLKENEIDILIGTHALFQDEVSFQHLGLVITDEQHRFGVNQRKRLKEKGENVDFLLMSATPIPRTLATTIYGDMDVSSIKMMPLNRKAVETQIITPNSLTMIEEALFEQLKQGRQIYIVCNAIEKSVDQRRNVIDIYHQLMTSNFFKEYHLGLLHGRMESGIKESVMKDFLEHKIDVLICTTVIEVGVNVPNATVMAIYDASRFGLSQLHQLRGRVIRGEHQGYCYLLVNASDQDKERLHILQETNDGFEIAEKDLLLRGPGDILGKRQSGLPSLILGDLLKDQNIIKQTKLDALEILNHPQLDENKHLIELITALNEGNIQYID